MIFQVCPSNFGILVVKLLLLMVQKSGQPVEFGSLSDYIYRDFYIPGGDRRISEP